MTGQWGQVKARWTPPAANARNSDSSHIPRPDRCASLPRGSPIVPCGGTAAGDQTHDSPKIESDTGVPLPRKESALRPALAQQLAGQVAGRLVVAQQDLAVDDGGGHAVALLL